MIGGGASAGYATPARVAMALRRAGASPSKPLLDFGCGAGLSGVALRAVGFDLIDGTDTRPDLLSEAESRGVYRQVWRCTSGSLGHVGRGDYATLVAVDAIGHASGRPETLDLLVGALAAGNFFAFALDAPTLADRAFTDRLDIACLAPDLEVAFEEDGPHRVDDGSRSTVFVLRRT